MKREQIINTILYRITSLNEKKIILDKEIENEYLKLKNIKRQIEEDNRHLIGRYANCTLSDSKVVVCLCTKVLCNEDFKIKALFSRKGKKIIVEYYEWI